MDDSDKMSGAAASIRNNGGVLDIVIDGRGGS
jgi:hypothetical protein